MVCAMVYVVRVREEGDVVDYGSYVRCRRSLGHNRLFQCFSAFHRRLCQHISPLLPRECVEEREHVEGCVIDIWRDTEIGVVGANGVAEGIKSRTLPTQCTNSNQIYRTMPN